MRTFLIRVEIGSLNTTDDSQPDRYIALKTRFQPSSVLNDHSLTRKGTSLQSVLHIPLRN
jgi:hypothetical protein